VLLSVLAHECYALGRRRRNMNEFLSIIAFLGFYFALQLWILPKMGIKT
jgi:hypothetical protein